MNSIENLTDLFQRLVRLLRARETVLTLFVGFLLAGLLGATLLLRQDRLSIPRVAVAPISVFPDFASITDVEIKKQMFFDFLELYIAEHNILVSETRDRISALSDVVAGGVPLSDEERAELLDIAQGYFLDYEEMRESQVLFELLKRVDTIPTPLALAQAANESAWGTSRFALEANNIFGQWCYDEGCGVVPNRRRADASHEVRAFETIDEAVQAYFLNLNTHERYQNFRNMRFQMRNQRGELDPLVLAYGLEGYSERGDKYVDEIQTIIQQNDLVDRYSG
jgi:Bax protein